MSELILASAFNTAITTPEFQTESAPIIRDAGKIALILAAGDHRYTNPDGSYCVPYDWIEKDTEIIELLGGTAEYLDFRQVDIDPDKLSEFGGFWVGGGNPFILAQRLRGSVVGVEMKKRHITGDLTYFAESAGAVVATNDMQYIWQVPSFIRTNTDHYRELLAHNKRVRNLGSTMVGLSQGLDLTDVKIVPHQDTINPPQHLLHNNEGVVYLRDTDYYSHARKKFIKSAGV